MENLTDETVIGEVCSADCMPERNYHLNCLGVPLKALDEPYRQHLFDYDKLEQRLKEAIGFIESLGEGNFSPENYDGDCYEAIKGTCEKFLKQSK